MKNVLPKLVEAFYLSNKISGKLEFFEKALPITDRDISGQLLDYYQHLSIEGDAYFGHSFFDMVLLPHQSEGTKPETWALQHDDNFQKRDYIIFAHTTSDDLLCCDVRDEECPVYGLISGSDHFYKLGDSLTNFLSFYTKLVNLEMKDFKGSAYSDENFTIKKEFIDGVSSLINGNVSNETQEGLTDFLLTGI